MFVPNKTVFRPVRQEREDKPPGIRGISALALVALWWRFEVALGCLVVAYWLPSKWL
jgi:hypothetical protein